MSEWYDTTLGEFAPLSYGRALPTGARVGDGPVPVYGSGGRVGGHHTALVEGPAIVLGRKGSVGAVHFSPGPCWPIDTTFYVPPSDTRDARFTYYLLRHLGLARLSRDSGVPGLSRNVAHRQPLRVPSLPAQQRIGAALGIYDDLIDVNRRRIAALSRVGRALYAQWCGTPAATWDVRPLADLATYVNGFAFTPAHHGATGRPIVKIEELKHGVTGDTPRCDERAVDPRYRVEPGDLLFSWSADLGVYRWLGEPALLNQHVFAVRPRDGLGVAYVHRALEAALPRLWSCARGTTMRHLKRGALTTVTVAVPPREALAAFTAAAEPFDAHAVTLHRENDRRASARDALLWRLVTGQRALGELTTAVASVA
jgi:type I restriction enzyme S subunit